MKDWTGGANSIYKQIAASNHSTAEREQNDYYATDPRAIDLLLTAESPNHCIWECACGGGHLSERLTELGYFVESTDLINRGYKRQRACVQDFLKAEKSPFINQALTYDILTNPPFKYAKEFVTKALELLKDGCKCYMFLKLTFLEGKARREEIFNHNPPRTVYVFSERISCAKNGDFRNLKGSGGSAVAYAWFVWQKGYCGETIVKWL